MWRDWGGGGVGGLYWLSRDDFRAYKFGGKCGHTLNHRCPIVIHAHFIFTLTTSSYLLKTKRINKTNKHEISFKKYDLFPFYGVRYTLVLQT